MYTKIVKNETGRTATLILLFLTLAVPARPFEQALVLGRADRWQDLVERPNVQTVPGRWGDLDLVLREGEYLPDPQTDLLLHFNEQPSRDSAGRYQVLEDPVLVSPQARRYGAAGGGFQRRGLVLAPGPQGLFRRGSVWSDFSIECWLHPLLLADGETVLGWTGSIWQDGHLVPQRLQAQVRDRRLRWSFTNLFADPGGRRLEELTVDGLSALVPRRWYHHLLRFDSGRGLLEYLVDGVPEAVLYTTSTGREGGTVYVPRIGEAGANGLEVGGGLTGFIDELRVSRRPVESPALTPYSAQTGQAVSRIFDLGYTGTRVRRIEAVWEKPADSAVTFHYRLADRHPVEWRRELQGGWVQFEPSRDLEGARGRYIQLLVELFPDGERRRSPQVSEIRIVFEPDLPPVAPDGLTAFPGDGEITLMWKRVNEADVRGYRIYYGEAPGNYHGTGCEQGDSPIDVGDLTRFTLTGLENDRLYYFAVVSYDGTDPPHLSAFSRQAGARPSRLFP
jgi:hypothetical protein